MVEVATTPTVLAICSAGGHWSQLRRLRPALLGAKLHFASPIPASLHDVPEGSFSAIGNFSRADLWKAIPVIMQIVALLLKTRPDVIITTGAAPGLAALVLGKVFFRSKTIWIDSIANSERISKSGALARNFSDVWLTQWPHLTTSRGPHYIGAVL